MSRDEILGLPDDALEFREWWQELTGRKPGTSLVARLRSAVASGTIGGLTESTEANWKEVARTYGRDGEADGLERAILCARLAMVAPGDGVAVYQLFAKLSLARPAEFAVIGRTRWSAWLWSVLDGSTEGSLLRPRDSSFSPVMAWDLVMRFWAERQDRAALARSPLPGCKSLVALLVDRRVEKASNGKNAYSEEGATAELKLELLPEGAGHIYPDPEGLLFVKQDESFREALASAQASVRELLGGDVQDYDVRWSLTRQGGQPLTELTKESAGAAFALGLTALWARSTDKALVKKLKALELSKVAVTAKLKREAGSWRFSNVDGVPAKVWAVAQRPEQVKVVYVAPGQPRNALPSVRVVEVSTLRELVDKLHKEPKERPAPHWSTQAVRRVVYLLLAISVAGGAWLYQLGRIQQAERELDHWRDKALVSVVPGRYSDPKITKVYTDDSDSLDRAQGLIHRRQFSEAERALDRAAQLGRSQLPRYYTLAGDIYYFQNQFDKAVPYYERAAIRAGPDDVDTLSDLALALQQSQRHDAPARIERALRIQRHIIALLESETSSRSSNAHRQKLACAHLNLARLLIDRPRHRIRSVEAGLKSLEKSLTVFTQQTDPAIWAYITSMQGGAWQNRPDGDRTDNLKHSIHYFEAALPVYRRLRLHRKVYHNSYMLGVAWGQLREGDRGANIEKALSLYGDADRALGDLGDNYPADRAKILRSRGLSLIYRRSGDRAVNLEEAIACFQGALKVFEQLDMRIDAAKTKNYLAGALLRRNRADREDVETAIEYLRRAADVFTKEEFEVEWAQVHHDLGTAYRKRLAGDPTTNLKESLACFEGALSVRARVGHADRLVTTLNGFGRTMLAMGDRDGDTPIYSAISLFDDALRLLPGVAPYREESGGLRSVLPARPVSKVSQAEVPEYLGETSSNLGDAWSALITGDRNRNRKIAINHYRTALQYYAGIPYYFPEYSETLRKLELLSGNEVLPRRRVAARRY